MSNLTGATPTTLPEWATDPTANVVEPSQAQKEDGWDDNDKVPAAWLNWWMENVYDWTARFKYMLLSIWTITRVYRSDIEALDANDDGAIAFVVGDDVYSMNSSGVDNNELAIGSGASLLDIHFNGSYWVAVGQDTSANSNESGVWKSADEDPTSTWTQQTVTTPDASTPLRAVSWGNGTWVAVGANGEIRTSTDGATWTARTADGSFTDDFWGVAYDATLDIWVIVGDGGEIQTAPGSDVTTWTARTADDSYTDIFKDVIASGDGTFVAVGDSGEIQYSTNGTSWTVAATSMDSSTDHEAVSYNDGIFIATGTGTGNFCVVVVSEDGINWDFPPVPFQTAGQVVPNDVAWTGRGWFIAGNNHLLSLAM